MILRPRSSYRARTRPTSWRCTPSGLMRTRVRSITWFPLVGPRRRGRGGIPGTRPTPPRPGQGAGARRHGRAGGQPPRGRSARSPRDHARRRDRVMAARAGSSRRTTPSRPAARAGRPRSTAASAAARSSLGRTAAGPWSGRPAELRLAPRQPSCRPGQAADRGWPAKTAGPPRPHRRPAGRARGGRAAERRGGRPAAASDSTTTTSASTSSPPWSRWAWAASLAALRSPPRQRASARSARAGPQVAAAGQRLQLDTSQRGQPASAGAGAPGAS